MIRALLIVVSLTFATPAFGQTTGDNQPVAEQGQQPAEEPVEEQGQQPAEEPVAEQGQQQAGQQQAQLSQVDPSQDTFKIGEPIVISLEVLHGIDTDLVLPDFFGSKRWTLVDQKVETQPHESGQRSTILLTFAVFRPGATELPAFDLIVLGRDGESQSLKTSPLSVKILDGLGDTVDPAFKPPRKPVEIWVEDYTLAWIGGIGSTLALFGLLGFFFWNRREVIVIPPPPRAPHEIALEKLSALAADDLMERGEFMLYYVRVSEAIREYMGNVHDFPGTELTTTEILALIKDKFFPPGISADDVGDFLRETDMVKFGGIEPSMNESERVLRRAFSIVELTRMPTVGLNVSDDPEGEGDAENDEQESAIANTALWAPSGEEE